MEPHSVQSAPVLRQPCVTTILELECLNIEEIQDRAFMCIIVFTGMRKDTHSVKSKNVAFVPGIDSKCLRRIDFKFTDASKNDGLGQGSRVNLTYSCVSYFIILKCTGSDKTICRVTVFIII